MRYLAAAIALFLAPIPLAAQVPGPDVIAAVRAADDGDYAQAFDLAGDDDPMAADLIRWMQLRDGQGSFADARAFLAARPDWPGLDRVRAAGEVAMDAGVAPADVLDFFGDTPPETGEGAVRLAQALIASGAEDQAKTALIAAWLDLSLNQSGHDAMVASFPDVLAPHHVTRTDALLWRWRTDEALRMLPLLDAEHQAWVNARIAFIRKTGGEEAALAQVSEALAASPGLAYDRFNWLSDKRERTDAIALLTERSVSAEALGDPFRWSGWRRSLARWEMREGRIDSAYFLASQHFMTDGSSFADLEWLAGYIALRYKDDAALALQHFDRFAGAVDSPISDGRAGYWQGRAHEALGDANAAAAAYADAAAHQTGFYGLLAAEKLGMRLDPALTGRGDATDWEGAAFVSADLTRAAIALLDAGERGLAVVFFAQLGKTLERDDIARLGAYLATRDESYYEVLLGKTAAARGLVIPSVYFPLHPLRELALPVPAELALSIARRESEFNIGVGSPVGALGLMQLMPATAQEVAGSLSLPYSKPRLTTDWEYNAILGSQYLATLASEFGYSLVQISAGYNAGPSRPRAWMDDYGDPRLGEVDVVDWIEHIPFRETRNYVMRVTESIPVYQARLTGETGPVRFTELLIGVKPLVRPRAREDRAVVVPAAVSTGDVPATAVAEPARIPGPSPVPGIRPIARPGG